MIYCSTTTVEEIGVHPMDNMKNHQNVELTKIGDESIFTVELFDELDKDWVWAFEMSCHSDYERVKLAIFDAISECETMRELGRTLNAIFYECFERILLD